MRKRLIIGSVAAITCGFVVMALCGFPLRILLHWHDQAFWLATLKEDKSSGMRAIAVKKLAEFYPRDKDTILAAVTEAMVADPHEGVRFEAAFFLRSLSQEAAPAIPAFGKALTDESPYVRLEAAYALLEFGKAARPVASALRDALKDPDEHVRFAAREALFYVDP